MRAVLCRRLGPPSVLTIEDLPEPEPGEGEILVASKAMGVNFVDVLMVAGGYQLKPELPFVPGLEAAGIVRKVGPGVSAFAPGDRVMTRHRPGAFAELAVVRADAACPIPDTVDFEHAAVFRSAHHTAYHALVQRAALKPGEVLLVHGAAGGVGLAAVQVGKLLGATVIATAGSAEKLAALRRLGADHAIGYREGFREAVKDLTGGRGADVIYDPVGGDVFDESMRCVAWGGRILVIGFTSGRQAVAKTNHILIKGISVVGVRAGEIGRRNPAIVEDNMRALMDWLATGRVTPHISHRYPLERVVDAMQAIVDREVIGKAVLTVE